MREGLAAAVEGAFAASRSALTRRDGRLAFGLALVGYPLIYLIALGHLSLGGDGTSVFVVSDPLARLATERSPFSYEPIARVVIAPVVVLVSPLNVLLGAALGVLVGANVAVSLVAWRAPQACAANSSAGVLAGIPGLLGGATCCGPAVFFLAGVQATGALISAVGVLVPLAFALLAGSLLLVGRSVDPATTRTATPNP